MKSVGSRWPECLFYKTSTLLTWFYSCIRLADFQHLYTWKTFSLRDYRPVQETLYFLWDQSSEQRIYLLFSGPPGNFSAAFIVKLYLRESAHPSAEVRPINRCLYIHNLTIFKLIGQPRDETFRRYLSCIWITEKRAFNGSCLHLETLIIRNCKRVLHIFIYFIKKSRIFVIFRSFLGIRKSAVLIWPACRFFQLFFVES